MILTAADTRPAASKPYLNKLIEFGPLAHKRGAHANTEHRIGTFARREDKKTLFHTVQSLNRLNAPLFSLLYLPASTLVLTLARHPSRASRAV